MKKLKEYANNIIKAFIDQYNWKKINFPSYKDWKDWKTFELNNNQLLLIPYMCFTKLKK